MNDSQEIPETSPAAGIDKAGEFMQADAGRQRARAPVFNLHGAIIALSLVCLAIHGLRVLVLSRDEDLWLLSHGAFFPLRYSPEMLSLNLPTIFSPITYSFLHGNWVHLSVNIVWLCVFGSPLAFRIGWLRTLGFWIVTALFAAVTHLAIYYGDMEPVIGASGAVSGFMGAAARFGLRANRRLPHSGFDGPLLSIGETFRAAGVVPFLLVWIAVNVVVGLDLFDSAQGVQIAWQAHLGGLAAGFLLIPLFDRVNSDR